MAIKRKTTKKKTKKKSGAKPTNPALWVTGEGAPDFAPSQYIHSAEIHDSYTDPDITFNNLYARGKNEKN